MLISPAFAHGAGPAGTGGYGPLVLLAVATVVVLLLAVERKIRRHRSRRDGGGR
ncbi:MAG: hypothetical protein ACE5GT_05835 [Rhodospirillales bacterium]